MAEIDEFTAWLGGNRSQSTVRAYATDISIMTKGIDNSVLAVENYVNGLKGNGYAPSTVNRKVSAANAFMQFMSVDKRFTGFSGISIDLTATTQEEFNDLMIVVPTNKFNCARNRSIYSLMFYNGMNLGDICRIAYDNFDCNVIELGEREFFMNDPIMQELDRYKKLYNKTGLPTLENGLPYFKNKKGMPISSRSIRRNLEFFANAAGVPVNSYSLRNGYIKRQFDANVNLQEIAAQLDISVERVKIIKQALV